MSRNFFSHWPVVQAIFLDCACILFYSNHSCCMIFSYCKGFAGMFFLKSSTHNPPPPLKPLNLVGVKGIYRLLCNYLVRYLPCRCSSVGKDEEDYRPLFENFVQDLLVMLNKPDWPAAELLLTLLGKLLVSLFVVNC